MHTALIPSVLNLPSVVQAPALPIPREVPVTLRTPELSVVIVNYHCWPETVNLVWKLRASPVLQHGIVEVVVVDNHSPHHPLARRLRSWSGVALRRWGRNRGFAQAVNEACRLSLGRWILLLNPDVQVPDNLVETVLAQVERLVAEDPQTGVVGFGLLNSDGSRQLSCGPFPTLASSLLRLVLPLPAEVPCPGSAYTLPRPLGYRVLSDGSSRLFRTTWRLRRSVLPVLRGRGFLPPSHGPGLVGLV